jgi:aminopeptidase-like protein
MNSVELNKLFDELFPICRSITGPGLEESLQILKKHIPIEINYVPTGTKVFDWIVPKEWKLNRAVLETEDGEKILSSDDSNIHVLNFSEPFEGTVSKEELEKHLHSIPHLPEAIPYVTSYYKERWGLCLSHKQRQSLPNCNYNVSIDVDKYDGNLAYGEVFLKGDTEDTVLITSYMCHPSMANNELSGPLALTALYKYLSGLKNRNLSYRFLIIPETIGSITYLATKDSKVIDNIVGGIVLTCLGGPREKLDLKLSRRDWLDKGSVIDKLARAFAKQEPDKYCIRDFTPTGGSDERQFCSPGINLPVIQAARTPYGDYDAYHTNLDTKDFMGISNLLDSIERLKLFISTLDLADHNLASNIKGGEPMLGRHNLYPTLNGPMTNKMSKDGAVDLREQLNLLLNVISLIDGTRNIIDISEKLSVPFSNLMPVVNELRNKGLI